MGHTPSSTVLLAKDRGYDLRESVWLVGWLRFNSTFSTNRPYRLLKMFISDRKLKMCCLEMLVKMTDSCEWGKCFSLIFLYAEHDVRMCPTVNRMCVIPDLSLFSIDNRLRISTK